MAQAFESAGSGSLFPQNARSADIGDIPGGC